MQEGIDNLTASLHHDAREALAQQRFKHNVPVESHSALRGRGALRDVDELASVLLQEIDAAGRPMFLFYAGNDKGSETGAAATDLENLVVMARSPPEMRVDDYGPRLEG